MDFTVNLSLYVKGEGYSGGSLPLKYLLPDGQIRSQEKPHYRRTRRQEKSYLGTYAKVENIRPSALSSEGEPKEAPQGK